MEPAPTPSIDPGAPTDGQIVARCRTGDPAAWNELVERFSRYVYAICAQGFRFSEHDCEDVFQDVFARIYEQLGKLRDDDAIRPWIAQLTRRICIDRLRASREDPSADVEPAGIDEVMSTLDEALVVREALARLNEPCRDILDRFFARDESYHTIAASLELPAGTIASRISRCLARLKTQMEDSGAPARPVIG